MATDGESANNGFFVSGSTVEGAPYARHFAQQSMQDFDFMLVEGAITSPTCLIKLPDVKGFVQIKFDDTLIKQFSESPLSTKENEKNISCINGLKMKEKYCVTESISFLSILKLIITSETAVHSASTNVNFQSHFLPISFDELFENALNNISQMKAQRNVEFLQPKFTLVCNALRKSMSEYVIPCFGKILAKEMTVQSVEDILSLIFPAYNIQMPQANKVRVNGLLEFYEKYKYLGNPSMLKDYIEYGQLSLNGEMDFVPAFQLQFWPDDVQPFFDRIQIRRPELYKLIIETSSMHLIPKWSTKTSEIDQELEFRYSFSAIERLLARNRSTVEQILNGVARSIYYKYLKNQLSTEGGNQTLIPSYFVKTTVLWMCESINLNEEFADTDDHRAIARIMAEKWLKYAKESLSSGVCKHYFIDGINLLETCSAKSLEKAWNILHEVHLDEDINIEIHTEQDKFLNKRRSMMEDWLGNLKIENFSNAIKEYKLLRENWLCPSNDIPDHDDFTNCLHLLSQLRALDGDKQQNWATYKRLFLDIDETNWLLPIWDEQVEHCSISNFSNHLPILWMVLNGIQFLMDKPDFDGTMFVDTSSHEFHGFENIFNDLSAPLNMIRNGLLNSWLPMFTSLYFNKLPVGIPSDVRLPFQRRSVISHHPVGPLENLLQICSLPSAVDSSTRQRFRQNIQHVFNSFINLLNNAPSCARTFNDLSEHHTAEVYIFYLCCFVLRFFLLD